MREYSSIMKSKCNKNWKWYHYIIVQYFIDEIAFTFNVKWPESVILLSFDSIIWFINCGLIYYCLKLKSWPLNMSIPLHLIRQLFYLNFPVYSMSTIPFPPGASVPLTMFVLDFSTVYINFIRTNSTNMNTFRVEMRSSKQRKWRIYYQKYFWFWFMAANKSCIYVLLPTEEQIVHHFKWRWRFFFCSFHFVIQCICPDVHLSKSIGCAPVTTVELRTVFFLFSIAPAFLSLSFSHRTHGKEMATNDSERKHFILLGIRFNSFLLFMCSELIFHLEWITMAPCALFHRL